MKTIYRTVTIVKSGKNQKTIMRHSSSIYHYGELPQHFSLSLPTFDDVYRFIHMTKEEKKQANIPYPFGMHLEARPKSLWLSEKITFYDYDHLKTIECYAPLLFERHYVPDENCTMHELFTRLSAKEYAEYCKDHNLNPTPFIPM